MKRIRAWGVSVTVALLAAPAASGQSLRSGRLYCEDNAYDFDQVVPSEASFFDVRRGELEALRDVVARAEVACRDAANRPWCRGFQASLGVWRRTAEGPCALGGSRACVEARQQQADAEVALLRNAQRAAAHQRCSRLQDARAPAQSERNPACDALVDAELAAAPEVVRDWSEAVQELRTAFNVVTPVTIAGTSQQAVLNAARSRQRMYLALLAYVRGEGILNNSEPLPEARTSLSGPPERSLRQWLFYHRSDHVPDVAPPPTFTAALEVELDSNAIEQRPCSRTPGRQELGLNELQCEIAALDTRRTRCERANLHVLPSGELRINGVPRREPANAPEETVTLCVDISEYQHRAPVEVELGVSAVDPSRTPLASPRTTRTPAWIGEVFTLALPSERGPVLRMIVHGQPRGRSLRVLAGRTIVDNPTVCARDIDALLRLQAEVNLNASALQVARDSRRAIALLASLATHLSAAQEVSTAFTDARAAANSLTGTPTAEATRRVQVRVAAAVGSIRRVVRGWVMNDGSPGAAAAVESFDATLRDLLRASTRTEMLDAVGAADAWRTSPPPPKLPADFDAWVAKERTLEEALARICRVARTSFRAVVHDLLLPTNGAPFDIVDYDAERGYVGTVHLGGAAGSNRGDFDERVPIFARVWRVAGNQNVFALVNGRPVVTASARVIGAGDAGVPADASVSSSAAAVEDAVYAGSGDISSQLPGTRIVQVGRLEGGMRHAMTICVAGSAAPTNAGASGNAPCGQGRAVANNEVTVHGRYYFGLIAGLGASWDLTDSRPYLVRDSATGNTWTVATNPRAMSLSAPLLLTAYLIPRDPMSNQPALGLGAGVDLADPLNRFLVGATLSFSSVGITAGVMARRPSDNDASPRAPSGAVITATGATMPSLVEIYGRDPRVQFSFFAAATFDFDLFRRAFEAAFKTRLPGIQ